MTDEKPVVLFGFEADSPAVAAHTQFANLPERWFDWLRAFDKCPDCGVSQGEAHDHGCDEERCGKCGGQWIACGCNDPEGESA